MDAAFDETYKGLGWVKGEAPKPSQSKPSTAPTGGNP